VFKETRKSIKENPEAFRAYVFGYSLGLGAGYAACKIMTREALKSVAVASADILLREDGASVIMVHLVNGTTKTLVKKVAKV